MIPREPRFWRDNGRGGFSYIPTDDGKLEAYLSSINQDWLKISSSGNIELSDSEIFAVDFYRYLWEAAVRATLEGKE